MDQSWLQHWLYSRFGDWSKSLLNNWISIFLGPFFGMWFFQIGGFDFPFVLFGILTFINSLLLTFVIPNVKKKVIEKSNNNNEKQIFTFFSAIKVWYIMKFFNIFYLRYYFFLACKYFVAITKLFCLLLCKWIKGFNNGTTFNK